MEFVFIVVDNFFMEWAGQVMQSLNSYRKAESKSQFWTILSDLHPDQAEACQQLSEGRKSEAWTVPQAS